MSNKPLNIVVYTRDRDFIKLCANKNFGAGHPKSKDFMVFGSTDRVEALKSCDLIIYDVDLAKDDQMQLTEDVLHLKFHALSAPLFLVGKRGAVKLAFADGNINRNADRAIAKPVLQSALDLHIETITSKASIKKVSESSHQDSLSFLTKIFSKGRIGEKAVTNS